MEKKVDIILIPVLKLLQVQKVISSHSIILFSREITSWFWSRLHTGRSDICLLYTTDVPGGKIF